MNNNITEDYCSFEVCKLLKEKGFNCLTVPAYNNEGNFTIFLNKEITTKAPTHALAIKWIRENFNIYISADRDRAGHFIFIKRPNDNNPKHFWKGEWLYGNNPQDGAKIFSTYEEAIEAALLYTLKNLI